LDAINETWAEAKATNIDFIGRHFDTTELYIAEDCYGRIHAVFEKLRDRLLGMVTYISGETYCTSPSRINSAGPSAAATNFNKVLRINKRIGRVLRISSILSYIMLRAYQTQPSYNT
jgi:hypothetical protein